MADGFGCRGVRIVLAVGPGACEHGFGYVFGSADVRIPHGVHIDNIIALDAIDEDAEIKVFVTEVVGEAKYVIWIDITDEGAIGCGQCRKISIEVAVFDLADHSADDVCCLVGVHRVAADFGFIVEISIFNKSEQCSDRHACDLDEWGIACGYVTGELFFDISAQAEDLVSVEGNVEQRLPLELVVFDDDCVECEFDAFVFH